MTTLAPTTYTHILWPGIKARIPTAILSGIVGDTAHAARGCY